MWAIPIRAKCSSCAGCRQNCRGYRRGGTATCSPNEYSTSILRPKQPPPQDVAMLVHIQNSLLSLAVWELCSTAKPAEDSGQQNTNPGAEAPGRHANIERVKVRDWRTGERGGQP